MPNAVLLRLREVERFGASGAVVTAPRVDLAVICNLVAAEIPNVSCFDGLLVYLLSIVEDFYSFVLIFPLSWSC